MSPEGDLCPIVDVSVDFDKKAKLRKLSSEMDWRHGSSGDEWLVLHSPPIKNYVLVTAKDMIESPGIGNFSYADVDHLVGWKPTRIE